MTTASNVIIGLETLINGALGSSENAATKLRIHAVASVLGSLGDEFAPLLESRFNVEALLTALQRVENGTTETEEGVRDLLMALKKKDSTTLQNATIGNHV